MNMVMDLVGGWRIWCGCLTDVVGVWCGCLTDVVWMSDGSDGCDGWMVDGWLDGFGGGTDVSVGVGGRGGGRQNM